MKTLSRVHTQLGIKLTIVSTAGVMALLGITTLQAGTPDWSKVPAKSVKLFYPGQSTYGWLIGPEHKKKANEKVMAGESCASCHEGEEADIGKKTASGERLEPNKLDDKQPVIDLKVQAAYDDKNLYWRFEWKTKNDYPGTAYPFYRFERLLEVLPAAEESAERIFVYLDREPRVGQLSHAVPLE